ncbi:M56 family metallopeptidase [Dethiobacter alkaliphilus]|uniref:Peptidase M56 BlaR1 n=1 Tax=Dethiobacter alkaliphilus AHT 1 TaxID=555088 RepID=C0GHR0_DETAL|nr:M56 family metallopeptidase [Dethiobacter alkaliphilus]EEG77266.1 peptidase M56 BlaR1 [Dethiobacter alkaliphilus AHT 1]
MSLTSVFEWVLRSSVMASILVLFILLIKLIVKEKLGAKWNYYVWLLVLIRLLLPVSIESSVSFFNVPGFFQQQNLPIVIENEYAPNQGVNVSEGETNRPVPAPSQEDVPAAQDEVPGDRITSTPSEGTATPDFSLFYLLSVIWFSGLILMAAYLALINAKFWLSIRNSNSSSLILQALLDRCKTEMNIGQDVRLIESDRVKTVTLFGFFKPSLLINPDIAKELTTEQLRLVFMHELAHIKQKDIVINWFAGLAIVMHWFNPVLWYSFFRMRQEREVACDAVAMSHLKPNEHNKYGQVIITLLEKYTQQRRIPGMIAVVGDNSNIKHRIAMINRFKCGANKLSVVTIIIVALLGGLFLTNANGNTAIISQLEEVHENGAVAVTEVRGNSTGNIVNGGLVAYQDGWIYYSNPQDEGRLYKKRTDGSEDTRLSNNSAMDINVVENWVYYNHSLNRNRETRSMGGSVYRVRTDGSEEVRLNDHSSSFVQVVDDWIYYLRFELESGGTVPYKMRLDGSEQTRIIDHNASELNVVDGWAYFIASERASIDDFAESQKWVYRVRTDGSDLTRLVARGSGGIGYLIVDGEWMYSNDFSNTRRTKTDGSNPSYPVGGYGYINVDGDWIYYVDIEDLWMNIYRTQVDDSAHERINDNRAENIFIVEDYVYYLSSGKLLKVEKNAPAQTGLKPREEYDEQEVREEIWQTATAILGEASSRQQDGVPDYNQGPAESGVDGIQYYRHIPFTFISAKLLPQSNRIEQMLDQIAQEYSAFFAELADMPGSDYLIGELQVDLIVYDQRWLYGIYILLDAETLINADWDNPTVEIQDDINGNDTFANWWEKNLSGNVAILQIDVIEENGTAKFIVGSYH